MADPHNLGRFLDAQQACYAVALAELRAGRKRSHWMWFIFPQLAALGRSETAQFYGIGGLGEAEAYLAHPVLGSRLTECLDAILIHAGRRSAEDIFGTVDAMKLRSSLTLFHAAGEGELTMRGLDQFFGGVLDKRTSELLSGESKQRPGA